MKRVCLPLVLLLAACAGPSQDPPPAGPAPRAEAPPAPPRSLDQLRQDAARALAEQRIYAPAGDNAIEAYLALRDQSPDARDLDLALLELLPYAVIASEQATARADLDEARRLLVLIERADPAAPSLARLRDGLARAEVRRREAAAQDAAEQDADAQAAAALSQAQAAIEPVAVPEAAAAPASPAVAGASPPATTPASADAPPAPPSPDPAAPPATTAAAASPAPPVVPSAPAPAPVALQLLSAPPPRYPPLALRRRIEGDVTVIFTVRTDGSVDAARVASAQPPGLFEDAALEAVRRWRFAPVARPIETRQVLNFRLPGRAGT